MDHGRPMGMGLLIPFLLLLASCGPTGNKFRIDGKFRDMKQGEIYIYNLDGDHSRLDTLQVKGGKFVYTGTTDEVTPYVLVFPNAVEQVIFVGGGQTLSYVASANDLRNYTVSGSDENELMNDFRQRTRKTDARQTRATAERFLKDNIASPVSIYLFHRYFVEDATVGVADIERLLRPLLRQHPDNLQLLNISGEIKMSRNGQVGQHLPPTEFTTQTKHTYTLGSPAFLHRRHYTLVGFWATWMPNQWDFMSRLREQTGKDDLQLVAVSLNNNIDNYRTFITPDSATIHHVCDGRAWESPLVRRMSIISLPTYVIADSSGRILHRGTDLAQMTRELNKLTR